MANKTVVLQKKKKCDTHLFQTLASSCKNTSEYIFLLILMDQMFSVSKFLAVGNLHNTARMQIGILS